jgi:hypothetical protein
MYALRSAFAGLTVVVTLAGWVLVGSGQQTTRAPLPFEPLGNSGQAIFPAYEGWFPNDDGTFTLLVGYFNRNSEQVLDIPVGPNNRIEPGGPDYGQPTHFLPRRHYGVFSITVPKDFGSNRYTWTLTANGQISTVSFGLVTPYQVEPFLNRGNGNTPPTIKFSPEGPNIHGPVRGISQTLEGTVGQAVDLRLWVTDKPSTIIFENPGRGGGGGGGGGGRGRGRGGEPPPPYTITWFKHSGPGDVTFANDTPPVDFKGDGLTETTATFDAPGTYVVRAQANDQSGNGGGGDQCCWTTAHVRVSVK